MNIILVSSKKSEIYQLELTIMGVLFTLKVIFIAIV